MLPDWFLHQHLTGEPKDMVSGCFHLDPEASRSMNFTRERIQRPLFIVNCLSVKDSRVVCCKAGPQYWLEKTVDVLTQCNHAMRYLSNLSILDYPSNILSIIQKLLFYLQNKWQEYVYKARQRGNSPVMSR